VAGGLVTYTQAYMQAWPERVLNFNILHPLQRVVERAVSSGGAPLTDRVLYGLGRYYLMLFPLLLAFAAWTGDSARRLLVYVVPSVLLSGLLIALFAT